LNRESNTVQITVNVVNRLSHSTFYSQLGKTQLATYDRVLRVGGFYSDDDGYRHALVNTGDGQLHEIFYNPATGQGDAILSDVGNLLGLAGFFTPDDSFRHTIVADANQSEREIFYSPASGLGNTTLATYGSIVDVGGFFSPDDGFRNAIVATTTGDIHEIFLIQISARETRFWETMRASLRPRDSIRMTTASGTRLWPRPVGTCTRFFSIPTPGREAP
jgi:hypothetical protein